MNPAWSVIFFTTLAGAAQGLVVTLALATLGGVAPSGGYVGLGLGLALAMLLASLGASTLHLGHPERAWRAVLMWRTSWLSREVIVLPVFIATVALWWWSLRSGTAAPWLPVLAIVLALALWWCTAMIYACLRFIQEWAHALTVVNYLLIGMASGLLLAAALAVLAGEAAFARHLAVPALVATLLAWATRTAALRRNAALKPKSTAQSATGIHHPRLRQVAMGMTGGAYNTREFFHGMGLAVLQRVRWALHGLAFAAPAAAIAATLATGSPGWLVAGCAVQALGLLAERWLFFAQARHPQNLYYQVVS
ncbi:DmsC/YnfH family molybdoenzyme membrane anchor subunit [Ideonella sp. A 288]|uniref:dimethyl sulfoxide reductase anchor subunit family protein n=1 Tax=Ideonella sp. A 288 TaxID=1962181 RepID=UPI000B4B6F53|nr:DmsC/YnfH family molybdoenzyme membrane anchor subunit [Ideonella sp. A 288]